jgi:hypothetical protein
LKGREKREERREKRRVIILVWAKPNNKENKRNILTLVQEPSKL